MAQNKTGIYRCIYDFKAEAPNDLELHKGDIVCVTKQISADWLKGSNGISSGQFPSNFVQLVFSETPTRVGIVLNDFVSEHIDDLQLFKDEIIGIDRDIDANWRFGFSKHGKGMFPSNFVQEVAFSHNNGVTNSYDTNNNNTQYGRAKVIDSFQAQDSDELTINSGDNVMLTREIDSFWIEGILNGKQGKFPRMYVDVIEELPEKLKCNEVKPEKRETTEPQAKALYMFVGTNTGEISFDKGDLITLVERLNKDWLVGKVGKTVGRFPSNYVEIIIDLPFTNKPKPVSKPIIRERKPSETSSVRGSIGAPPVDKEKNINNSPLRLSQPKPAISNKPTKPTNSSIKQTHSKPAIGPTKPTQPITTPSKQNQPQPVVAKVVANNIAPVQKKRAAATPPVRSESFRSSENAVENALTTDNHTNQNHVKRQHPNIAKKVSNGSIKYHESPMIMESNNTKPKVTLSRNGSVKSISSTDELPAKQKIEHTNSNPSSKGLQRKSSKKKPPTPPPHQFELVEEKIFDMYSKPVPKPQLQANNEALERKKSTKKPIPPPKSPTVKNQVDAKQTDLLTSSPTKQNKTIPRLPKPLAPRPPMGTTEKKARPVSLNVQPTKSTSDSDGDCTSPVMKINANSFSVSFSTKKKSTATEFEGINRPSKEPVKINGLSRERPKSLYFASSNSSAPSPEKRSLTLDAVLQRV